MLRTRLAHRVPYLKPPRELPLQRIKLPLQQNILVRIIRIHELHFRLVPGVPQYRFAQLVERCDAAPTRDQQHRRVRVGRVVEFVELPERYRVARDERVHFAAAFAAGVLLDEKRNGTGVREVRAG